MLAPDADPWPHPAAGAAALLDLAVAAGARDDAAAALLGGAPPWLLGEMSLAHLLLTSRKLCKPFLF